MDTMTYAAIAVIPASIAQKNEHQVSPAEEFAPLDLSYIIPSQSGPYCRPEANPKHDHKN
jgi:hypothetical protein